MATDLDAPVGIETKIHSSNGELQIERVADVQGVLDRAANLRSQGRTKTAMGDYHLGTIPAIIIEQYCNQVGITWHDFCVDDTHVNRILTNSDFKHFRVFEGSI